MLREKSMGATFLFDFYNQSPLGKVRLAVAIGIAYFMAAELGLALRSNTGTSVFWPAAGISVGALIVWGPEARLSVAAAVVVATAISNLTVGRNPWLAGAFGAVNAGQALLTTGLIERWFGRSFKLGDVPQVLGFLMASAIGASVAALGAAIAVGLIQSTASPFIVWRYWFASCLLGIVTVAPLLVEIGEAVRQLPPRRELVDGVVGILMLAALSAFVISLPQGPWSTALPVALVFPVLLWVIVRCRPVFATTAAFVVASAIVWSITFGVGHFGDASVPLADSILAAQTIVLASALLTLVLAALFAERRRDQASIVASEARLAEEAAALKKLYDLSSRLWETHDLNEGLEEMLRGSIQLMGADKGNVQLVDASGVLRVVAQQGFDRPFLEFFKEVSVEHNSACASALRTGRRVIIADVETDEEFAPFRKIALAAGFRAVQATPLMARDGRPVGVLSTHFCNVLRPSEHAMRTLDLYVRLAVDFIERYRAEEALRQSEERYKRVYENAGTGIYIADLSGRFQYCNPAYASMHGYTEEELRKLRTKDLVHPEDWPRHTPEIQLLSLGKIRSFEIMNRCISKGGDLLWVHKHVSLLRDATGCPESTIALVTDMTERKRAEDARELLNAELDHRVKNALATVSAVVSHTQRGSRSVADFVAALKGRLRTMATTHEQLSARRWQGVSLTELVRREVAPYSSSNNTKIKGPEVVLEPAAGMAMAMVLHELATNAAKHGALSDKKGRVSIRWERRLSVQPPDLVLEWQEIGGPPVVAPDKSNFGMSTIRDLIPYEFGGTVDLTLARDGARCRVELPADWLSSGCAPASEVTPLLSPVTPEGSHVSEVGSH
jgi:PAS domain S-box-containing protein